MTGLWWVMTAARAADGIEHAVCFDYDTHGSALDEHPADVSLYASRPLPPPPKGTPSGPTSPRAHVRAPHLDTSGCTRLTLSPDDPWTLEFNARFIVREIPVGSAATVTRYLVPRGRYERVAAVVPSRTTLAYVLTAR